MDTNPFPRIIVDPTGQPRDRVPFEARAIVLRDDGLHHALGLSNEAFNRWQTLSSPQRGTGPYCFDDIEWDGVTPYLLIGPVAPPVAGMAPLAHLPHWYTEQLPWWHLGWAYTLPTDRNQHDGDHWVAHYLVQAPNLEYAKGLIGSVRQFRNETPRGFAFSQGIPSWDVEVWMDSFDGPAHAYGHTMTVLKSIGTCSHCGHRGRLINGWCDECPLPF
jgi:hypothetical protein